jgi:hypothetical protein
MTKKTRSWSWSPMPEVGSGGGTFNRVGRLRCRFGVDRLRWWATSWNRVRWSSQSVWAVFSRERRLSRGSSEWILTAGWGLPQVKWRVWARRPLWSGLGHRSSEEVKRGIWVVLLPYDWTVPWRVSLGAQELVVPAWRGWAWEFIESGDGGRASGDSGQGPVSVPR